MDPKGFKSGKEFTQTAMQLLRKNEFVKLAEIFIEKDRLKPGDGHLHELLSSLRNRYNEISENSCDYKIMNMILQAEQMVAEHLGDKMHYLYSLFEEIINCCCLGEKRYVDVESKLTTTLMEMNLNRIKAEVALNSAKMSMLMDDHENQLNDVNKAIVLADKTLDYKLKRKLYDVKDKILAQCSKSTHT